MAVTPDPWQSLRALTKARIALGRAGGSVPTAAWLAFRLAHARARDAVWQGLNTARLEEAAEALGMGAVVAASAAPDHEVFLRRPDLGRALRPGERERLAAEAPADLAIIVSGGLSAAAVEAEAPAVLGELLPRLARIGVSTSRLVVVALGRVALSDAIGAALSARAVLMLIGERPGLGTPASLGGYVTHAPRPGLSDADRNCVSNIHAQGLSPPQAAHKLAWLVAESLRRGLSGVALKDESDLASALPVPRTVLRLP